MSEKKQVQVVDQTTHPPKCHSFVGLDRQIGSSPPANLRSLEMRKFYICSDVTHTHWYPSHLQMKDQGRKLSCKNDRLQQFLCLLVLLLDTYFLEKTLLHFMKKIAVRPSKVQHPEIHTACADLYC